MWTIFAQENLFFALHVFSGLVFFSVAWLYYDAYHEIRNRRDLWEIFGFTLLGISFFIRGMDLRQLVLLQNLDIIIRVIGYSFLIIGLLADPLQMKPKISALILVPVSQLLFLSPILSVFVAFLYLRRASVGLERHLYPPAISFFFVSLYEILFSLNNFRDSTNLNIFNALAPYGFVWYVALLFLVLTFLFLSNWVFRYLLKQFQSQLFMLIMCLVLAIYLIVTVSFTGLLLNNLKSQILNELTAQSKVLNFAFDAKKSELMSASKLIAINKSNEINNIDVNSGHDTLVIFDKDGVVTYREEDTERKGDSISGDVLVKKILTDGKDSSNIIVKDGVIAPTVMLMSGSPILVDGNVEGGVIIGDLLDGPYLDGFSKLTGLNAAVYGGDILSAGGVQGVKETDKTVKEKVLINGQIYQGENKWLNRSYLSVYSPLKDLEGNIVGMIFVGRPQSEVIKIASKTLESIFLGTIILLFISMIPAKIMASGINKQIH